MAFRYSAAVFALLFVFCNVAGAQKHCDHATTSRFGYRWCHYPGSVNKVVFYFHGNGEDERAWELSRHELLKTAWGGRSPHVISISLGPTWFLNKQDVFALAREALPQIEASLGITGAQRILLGQSMGGWNALQVYSFSPESFRRVAALCPAVLPLSPFASREPVESFLGRHRPHVSDRLVLKWLQKLRSAYGTEANWRDHDPLTAAFQPRTTGLFISADGRDIFGFDEGTQTLAESLQKSGSPVTYVFSPTAGHCESLSDLTKALSEFFD